MDLIEISTEEVSFTNKELNKATKEILKIGNNIKKDMFKVAVILYGVRVSECYKDDGFKNIGEYANKTFGFAKTNTYNLIKVAESYIDMETKESNLPHESGKDFTTAQIIKMLPTKYERVYELVENEVITPEMSCREIEKALKESNASEGEGEGEGDNETATEQDIETTTTTIELTFNAEGQKIIKINGVERDLQTALDELNNWK